MKTLPEISQQDIEKAKEDTWDFLFLFIDKYAEIIEKNWSDEKTESFNDSQHTLMAFNNLYGQVCNGGFLQLIQNGYGSYIFDTPFSESIKAWGAKAIADIVDDARKIYEQHRAELEKQSTLEEFSEMYEEYTQFEPLDDKFYEVMDTDLEKIKTYVENHLGDFATIIK